MPSVPSPCVRVCVYDERQGYCLGCLRTAAEISAWQRLEDDARQAVLARVDQRRQEILERWQINPSSSRRTD